MHSFFNNVRRKEKNDELKKGGVVVRGTSSGISIIRPVLICQNIRFMLFNFFKKT